METRFLRINSIDNVAVAIVNLPTGERLSIDGTDITLNEDIPAGHKFALRNFPQKVKMSLNTAILLAMHSLKQNKVTG